MLTSPEQQQQYFSSIHLLARVRIRLLLLLFGHQTLDRTDCSTVVLVALQPLQPGWDLRCCFRDVLDVGLSVQLFLQIASFLFRCCCFLAKQPPDAAPIEPDMVSIDGGNNRSFLCSLFSGIVTNGVIENDWFPSFNLGLHLLVVRNCDAIS